MGTNTVYMPTPGGGPLYFKVGKPVKSSSRSSEVSETLGQASVPEGKTGAIIPAVLGRKRVSEANIIWTGNLRPLTETTSSQIATTENRDGSLSVGGSFSYMEEVTTVTTVTATTVIGYLCDIHFGVALGPDVSLIGIYVDNKAVWIGDIGPARTTFTIGENVTFLSKTECVFSGGAFNQAPEPDIAVADYPGYVGLATVLLKGVRADLPMGQISFEVRRLPNPLGLDAGINASGDDLNVISALAEVMTNEWGYGSLDPAALDVDKLSEIAEVMADDGNFASVKIASETPTLGVIKSLLEQANVSIFQDPATGLVTGTVNTNPEQGGEYASFGTHNIIELRNFNKSSWADVVAQGRGSYTERDADYNEVPVFVQNPAISSVSGRGKNTANFYYPYVPNKTLALKLTTRDTAQVAAPVYSFQLVTNRDGAKVLPGDVIRVSWPKFKLLNVLMRVVKVRKQDLTQNTVIIDLAFADFGSIIMTGTSGAIYDPSFDLSPHTPTGVAFYTAPYFVARAGAGLASLQVTPLVYPLVFPKPYNDFQYSWTAWVTNMSGASGDSELVSDGAYPTYAKLNGAISQYANFDDGIIPSLTIDGVINPVNLRDIGNNGVREGKLLMFIDGEILSFEDATNNGDGTWTLSNVHRALLDTIFTDHADNADVWIINNSFRYMTKGFSYPLGFTPAWEIGSNSLIERGFIADALSSSDWTPTNNRTLAPPRPHNLKINGNARSSTPVDLTEGASCTVTWNNRSRIASRVSLMLDGPDASETVGTIVQKVNIYARGGSGSDTLITTVNASAGTATFTVPDVADGTGYIALEAEMIVGGVTYRSIHKERVPAYIHA